MEFPAEVSHAYVQILRIKTTKTSQVVGGQQYFLSNDAALTLKWFIRITYVTFLSQISKRTSFHETIIYYLIQWMPDPNIK